MQPVVRRMPAKRCALSFSLPRLVRPRGCAGQFARLRRAIRAPCLCFLPARARTRGCAGQIAHRVCISALPRTHAVLSGCAPAHGFCFPGQAESLHSCSLRPGENPPGETFHEYAKRGAKRTPTHRNARKAELCSFGFSGVSLVSRRFAARRAVKPASSERKGVTGRRAQASPFAQKRLKS